MADNDDATGLISDVAGAALDELNLAPPDAIVRGVVLVMDIAEDTGDSIRTVIVWRAAPEGLAMPHAIGILHMAAEAMTHDRATED